VEPQRGSAGDPDIPGPYVIIDDVSETTSTSPRKRGTGGAGRRAQAEPQPLRFFGTTWVEHGRGYRRRRVAVAAGSLAAAAAGAFVLRLGFQGLTDADVNVLLVVLAVCGFAVCTALAFQRTWQSFSTPAHARAHATGARSTREAGDTGADADASRGVYAIGFIGVLLAYFLRSLSEAPGEGAARAAYESALRRR
jgi:hypothetical protein